MLYIIIFIYGLIAMPITKCMGQEKEEPISKIAESNSPESLFNIVAKKIISSEKDFEQLFKRKDIKKLPQDVIDWMIDSYILHSSVPILNTEVYHHLYKRIYKKEPHYSNIPRRCIQKFLYEKTKNITDENKKILYEPLLQGLSQVHLNIPLIFDPENQENNSLRIWQYFKNVIRKMRRRTSDCGLTPDQADVQKYHPIDALITVCSYKPKKSESINEDMIADELHRLMENYGKQWQNSNFYVLALAAACKHPTRLKVLLDHEPSIRIKNQCVDLILRAKYRFFSYFESYEKSVYKSVNLLYKSGAHATNIDDIRYRLPLLGWSSSFPEQELLELKQAQEFLEKDLQETEKKGGKPLIQDISRYISYHSVKIDEKNEALKSGLARLSKRNKKKLQKILVGGTSIFPRSKYTANYLCHLYACILDVHSAINACKRNKKKVVDLRPLEHAVLQRNKETIFERNGGKLLLLTGAVAAGTILKEKQCTII